MLNRLSVAGVPVDTVTMKQASDLAVSFLADGKQHLVVTPNPEMAVLAARDPDFARALWASDLAICDGFGLKLAAGKRVPELVHGVDFVLNVAQIAEQYGYSVFLLGGGEGIAERTAAKLEFMFPKIRIVGTEGGRIEKIDGEWRQDPSLIDRLADAKPDILFVALGHGKQEKWLRDHLPKLPSVRLAAGVGGAFDYVCGAVRRAPDWLRAIHLEWLYRLFHEPKRWRRIYSAVVVFPLLALKFRRKGLK